LKPDCLATEVARLAFQTIPGRRFEGSAAKPLNPRNRFARDSAHDCSPAPAEFRKTSIL
jgi:hypothetical protein